MIVYQRKYGETATINFPLYGTDGVDLKVDATFAAGDVKIMKDEAAEANTSNLPADEGTWYSLVFTAAEMTAKRIAGQVKDQTNPKAFLDFPFLVETYGTASAQHPQKTAYAV